MQKHKKKKEMIEMLLKKGIFMTAAALTASCFLSLGVSAAGEMTGRVTTKTSPLTVRASASIEAQKLGSLARGSTVTLLSRTGDWWHVEYAAGKTGYCHAGYITVLENVGKRPAVSLAVPDYKQYDSRWAEVLVGGSGQTMKRIGCGTSFSPRVLKIEPMAQKWASVVPQPGFSGHGRTPPSPPRALR